MRRRIFYYVRLAPVSFETDFAQCRRLYEPPDPAGILAWVNHGFQILAVIVLPQRGQSVDEDAQLVPQLEQVEQLVQPVTFDTLPEQALFEQELQ